MPGREVSSHEHNVDARIFIDRALPFGPIKIPELQKAQEKDATRINILRGVVAVVEQNPSPT